MTAMRTLGIAFVVLLLATFPAAAQEDPAAHHHHDAAGPLTREQLETVYKQITGRDVPKMVVESGPVTNAAKAFTITARSFDFAVSPAPFTVHVGDSVTLTITVPSNDESSIGHGVFLPPFVNVNVGRGQTVVRTFTVTGSPDDYPYVCTQSNCGFGHTSMVGNMHVDAAVANPAPTIASVDPSTVSTSGGASVTIGGTNFVNGATVRFDTLSASSVSFVSATQLIAIAPAHSAGAVTVTVTNPDNQSATSAITYVSPGPAIASVSPASGPNLGGTRLTISGSGFLPGATVTIGALTATNVTVVDSATITATTPSAPASAPLGVAQDVAVHNTDGTSTTKSGAFTYTLAPLTISSISPNSGKGGTIVALRGSGFTATQSIVVTFGGVPATSVAVLDAATLQVTAPNHANGVVDVVVSVGSQSVTSLGGFTYAPAPARRRAIGHP
jgi:plastocyanin